MKIHLICPFYRKHLLLTLIHYLEPMNIEWHPVCDFVDIEAFKETDPAWIHPILCKPLRIPGDTSFRKLNDYIDSFGIGKYDYLVWLEALERQANLDKMLNIELQLELHPNTGSLNPVNVPRYFLYLWAETYNVLRIYGGRAGLLFGY